MNRAVFAAVLTLALPVAAIADCSRGECLKYGYGILIAQAAMEPNARAYDQAEKLGVTRRAALIRAFEERYEEEKSYQTRWRTISGAVLVGCVAVAAFRQWMLLPWTCALPLTFASRTAWRSHTRLKEVSEELESLRTSPLPEARH